MSDAKILSFAERFINLRDAFKEDVETLTTQAKEAEVDMPALRRLVSWMSKDETDRAVQEAIDDQYRFLAGLLPAPAELPPESELATAAALFADKMTIRAVAKEMGISVGKAHKLKTLAAAFNVQPRVNVNTLHDPETGEITQTPEVQPAGNRGGTAVNEAAQPAAVAITESCGSRGSQTGTMDNEPRLGATDALQNSPDGQDRNPDRIECTGDAGVAPGPQDLIADIGNIPPFLDRRAHA